MRGMFCIFVVSTILLAGCTSHHFVQDQEFFYRKINKEFEGKQGSIKLASGQTMKGKNIKVARDSTSWVEAHAQSKRVFPTSEVIEIRIQNRVRDTVGGVLYGLIGGSLGGAFCGLVLGSTTQFSTGRVEVSTMNGLIYGLASGATVGLVWGVAGGYTDIYFLNTPTDSTHKNIRAK
jgi:hypothetical protein